MEKALLDTSFICAFFNSNDSNHDVAIKISEDIAFANILIPSVVFAELMSLSKDTIRRDSNIKISLDIADEIPCLNKSNLRKYIEFTKNLTNSFTTIDSIILFLAKENNAELVTLDKKLQKLYKRP